MRVKIAETGNFETLYYMTRAGENMAADLVVENAPDCDLAWDDQDHCWRMPQESFSWWEQYIADLVEMYRLMAQYKARFGDDDVDQVVWSIAEQDQFGEFPKQVTAALLEAFGPL